MPENQKQDNDRKWNADQPQQNTFTHDGLLFIVSLSVQHSWNRPVPFLP
jgi:hypothetical protein